MLLNLNSPNGINIKHCCNISIKNSIHLINICHFDCCPTSPSVLCSFDLFLIIHLNRPKFALSNDSACYRSKIFSPDIKFHVENMYNPLLSLQSHVHKKPPSA